VSGKPGSNKDRLHASPLTPSSRRRKEDEEMCILRTPSGISHVKARAEALQLQVCMAFKKHLIWENTNSNILQRLILCVHMHKYDKLRDKKSVFLSVCVYLCTCVYVCVCVRVCVHMCAN